MADDGSAYVELSPRVLSFPNSACHVNGRSTALIREGPGFG